MKRRAPWYLRYCPECGRSFDLRVEDDCEAFQWGHDCES